MSSRFSTGVVLYETFAGASGAEALASLLKEQPPPSTTLVTGLPKELERIILRCLRKNPDRRFQHMTDLKVELQEVKDDSDSQAEAPAVAPARHRRQRVWLAAGLAMVLLAATGLFWYRERPTGSPTGWDRKVEGDIAFVARERLGPELPAAYWQGAPDLAVEVLSPGERERDVQAKVRQYLACGTKAVWVVRPRTRTVVLHHPDAVTVTLTDQDTLSDPSVLPGFRFRLAGLFEGIPRK